MRDDLLAFLAPGLPALQFAFKTLLGAGLALWFALRLGLDQPQWALMTAFIVAQPLSGMVVQKGLARITGTLVGAFISLVIMAFSAQAPWLFLTCMALWIGLCTAASTLLRSAWSYAFVLSGYTVVLIAMPALAEPLAVFDHAVARCTEILLGITCATTVSAIFWPQHVERQLAQQARAAWHGALETVAGEVANRSGRQPGLLALLGQIVAVDMQREHAWFEGRQGRQRARAVRALGRSLLSLLRTARAVGRQQRELEAAEAALLQPWFDRVQALLAQVQLNELRELRRQLAEQARNPALGANPLYCLGRLVLLLEYLEAACGALTAVEQGGATEDASGTFAVHRDPSLAMAYGLRGALTFLLLASFWLATGWTSAVSAMVLAVVVCGLFASRENAVQIGFSFLRGILLAIPVAFICGQLLLPQWSGFALLCLALGVPLFFGALGMARPAIAGTATSFSLHFIVMTMPPPGHNYDVAFFLNEALAMLLGVGCAVMAFRLFGLRNPLWHSRRLLAATLRDLGQLTWRKLAGAEVWFAGRMADRLLQLARHRSALPEQERSRWDDGVLGLDMGDELLHLRLCLAAARPVNDALVGQALQEMELALLRGPATGQLAALDRPVEKLIHALDDAEASPQRRLAIAAALQLQRSWRQWCRVGEVANGLA